VLKATVVPKKVRTTIGCRKSYADFDLKIVRLPALRFCARARCRKARPVDGRKARPNRIAEVQILGSQFRQITGSFASDRFLPLRGILVVRLIKNTGAKFVKRNSGSYALLIPLCI
jgi:hypothetical protein